MGRLTEKVRNPTPVGVLTEKVSCLTPVSAMSMVRKVSVGSEVEVVVTDDAAGLANFKTKVADLQQVTVSNLTFAIPLVSRKETHVMDAISTVCTKLRALQVPVYRINTDRAGNFKSWCLARDLEFTASAGDEPTGNARVEQEIGSVKRATRVLLKSAGLDETFWPLALRHAGEYILRRQLEQFGLRQPKLLPFGSQVLVKRKTWKMRGEAWRWPMEKAVVLGPAEGMSASSNAHWVQLEDGTGFRTTIAVRPRFSATATDGAVECPRPLLELDDRGEEILDDDDEPCPSLAEGEFEAARDEWIAEMDKLLWLNLIQQNFRSWLRPSMILRKFPHGESVVNNHNHLWKPQGGSHG